MYETLTYLGWCGGQFKKTYFYKIITKTEDLSLQSINE